MSNRRGIIVICHDDLDGKSSGALIAYEAKSPVTVYSVHTFGDGLLVAKENPELDVIFLDICPTDLSILQDFSSLYRGRKITVVDHHYSCYLQSLNFRFCRNLKVIVRWNMSTTKIVWDMLYPGQDNSLIDLIDRYDRGYRLTDEEMILALGLETFVDRLVSETEDFKEYGQNLVRQDKRLIRIASEVGHEVYEMLSPIAKQQVQSIKLLKIDGWDVAFLVSGFHEPLLSHQFMKTPYSSQAQFFIIAKPNPNGYYRLRIVSLTEDLPAFDVFDYLSPIGHRYMPIVYMSKDELETFLGYSLSQCS